MLAEYERANILERSRRASCTPPAAAASTSCWGALRLPLRRQARRGGSRALRSRAGGGPRGAARSSPGSGRSACPSAGMVAAASWQGAVNPRTPGPGPLLGPAPSVWRTSCRTRPIWVRPASGSPLVGDPAPRLRSHAGVRAAAAAVLGVPQRCRSPAIPIAVPALVSDALFAAVAEQLAENLCRPCRPAQRGSPHLLQGAAGLPVLRLCPIRPIPLPLAPPSGRSRRSYGYYRCTGAMRKDDKGERLCRNRPVRSDDLEVAVWQDVCQLLQAPGKIEAEYERRLGGQEADRDRTVGGSLGHACTTSGAASAA